MAQKLEPISIQDLIVASDGEELALRTTGFRKFKDVTLDAHGAYELIDYLNAAFESQQDRRRAYRVNLTAFSGVKIKVYLAQGEYTMNPQSISLTGLSGELPADLELEEGARVRVLIEYEGRDLVMSGVVRRRKGNSCGIFLPETIVDENLAPPPLLEQLIHDAQRRDTSFSQL